MSKIRALNEYQSSSESEDETNRKLSKEAQEEQAKLKYNQALKSLAGGENKNAVELLEKLLHDPCLYPEDDTKQFSPFQQQLQLGCLKFLGQLYRDGECKDLNRAKLMYERALYFDQDDNINLWFGLGKICYEIGDLYTASTALDYTLKLRPYNWICLELMITISYVTQDYLGCLNYCSHGLARDQKFVKGLVFRDLVYKVVPELREDVDGKVKYRYALNSSTKYVESWKNTYLDELRGVEARLNKRIDYFHHLIEKSTPMLQLNLKTLSLVDVVKEVLRAYENFLHSKDFHKEVEVTWKLQDANIESDDFGKPSTTEESQTEEESQSAQRRESGSQNDGNAVPVSTGPEASSQMDTNDDKEKKSSEEMNSENSLPLESQSQSQNTEGETGNKKKNRKDVKWWQMEGKRRSQRVRGHLMPISPEKTKKENSFAEQLKNLIPASLLGDDGTSCERQSAKVTEKSSWQKKMSLTYFGTKEEEAHVKQLLAKLSGKTLAKIVIETTRFLANTVRCPWPPELQELYLMLYKNYRSHASYPNLEILDSILVVRDVYTSLTCVEIMIEKYRGELSADDRQIQDQLQREVFFIDEYVHCELESPPRDFKMRLKWLTARRLLQIAISSNDEQINSSVCSLLADIETDLRTSPMTVWTVNETANLICLESVTEKAATISKMQNSQLVTDLYNNAQHDQLIEVLEKCINFAEIEKRDLLDIFYYTTSLFRTGKSDCIHQCLNLVNNSIRFQENEMLNKSLVLLEEIWEVMQAKFTLQDKRTTVGSVIKILVACERKAPVHESIVTIPWCILHSIMFSLEREEPAFYMEEETVPNSVLLLQMAHECMSRSDKCCIDNGKLMFYIMKAILRVKKLEEYFAFEETKHCMEQATFCLFSFPGKKSKAKNLKDHNSNGIPLTWEMCPTLYHCYCPDELPEFDSYGSISAEVEGLFQRFLELMPRELKPQKEYETVNAAIRDAKLHIKGNPPETFPRDFYDIYYLIGKYNFKNKDWQMSVEYSTWDLAINPSRFDSWAVISLSLAEDINTTINTADKIDFKDIVSRARTAAHCFQSALTLEGFNFKLRIEFGSFIYAMHAYCSRLMKQQADSMDMELFNVIQKAKDEFLHGAFQSFNVIVHRNLEHTQQGDDDTSEDEQWIHHYMLGKISEKMREDPEEFLKQYELAAKLLHDQKAPYPSKMNYYSPPELAVEALEVYYRIHASILNLVESTDYSAKTEKIYVAFIRRQAESPFAKCKQSRGEGGEGKRGRKQADDSTKKLKKEMAEIAEILKSLVNEAEKLVDSNPQATPVSTTSTSSSSDEETSSDSVETETATGKSGITGFSLSDFRRRLEEKEQKQAAIACGMVETTGPPQSPFPPAEPEPEPEPEDIFAGLDLENNHFYNHFKEVKFGGVIALCLKAMEECISRYASHYKSYYRIAHSYRVFLNDAERAKEYLMGSANLSQRKISGLYGERKANNFFNGIWRNPIDDIDRPGSFSYHMNKAMHLLLDILTQLNDHQILADIVLHLAKVPENEKKYLSNPDREMFCQQAFNCCSQAVNKKLQKTTENLHELGIEVYETHLKLLKHSTRQSPIPGYLHEIYKAHLKSQQFPDEGATVDHAIRYFGLHHAQIKAIRVGGKGPTSSQNSSQEQRSCADGVGSRKRGRRNLRQTSQEGANPTTSQDQDILDSALALQNIFTSSTTAPFQFGATATTSSQSSIYPRMEIDAVDSVINPLLSLKTPEFSDPIMSTPPPAHDSSRATKASLSLIRAGDASAGDSQTKLIGIKESDSVCLNDAKSSTGKSQQGRAATSKYPPDTPVQQIRLNTSPYKAQQTMVERPPEFSYNKRNSESSTSATVSKGDPPIAHAQRRSQTQTTTQEGDTDDCEIIAVIDLSSKRQRQDRDRSQEVRERQEGFAKRLEKEKAKVQDEERRPNFTTECADITGGDRAANEGSVTVTVVKRVDRPPQQQKDSTPTSSNKVERSKTPLTSRPHTPSETTSVIIKPQPPVRKEMTAGQINMSLTNFLKHKKFPHSSSTPVKEPLPTKKPKQNLGREDASVLQSHQSQPKTSMSKEMPQLSRRPNIVPENLQVSQMPTTPARPPAKHKAKEYVTTSADVSVLQMQHVPPPPPVQISAKKLLQQNRLQKVGAESTSILQMHHSQSRTLESVVSPPVPNEKDSVRSRPNFPVPPAERDAYMNRTNLDHLQRTKPQKKEICRRVTDASKEPVPVPSFPPRKRPIDIEAIVSVAKGPPTSATATQQRLPNQEVRSSPAYPLPPKKKHQMMFQQERNAAPDARSNTGNPEVRHDKNVEGSSGASNSKQILDPDVEVIIID